MELIVALGISLLGITLLVWRLAVMRKPRRASTLEDAYLPQDETTDGHRSKEHPNGRSRRTMHIVDDDQFENSSKAAQLKVEELSDVIQEADFWIALNDPSRAIEILQSYAIDGTPDSPAPWLYLLNIYADGGRRDDYLALQQHIKEIFNVSVPAWGTQAPEAVVLQLEDYPHVVKQIGEFWGTAMICPYLDNLLFDDRKGQREGFPLSVYKELLELSSIARGASADSQQPAWLKRLNA